MLCLYSAIWMKTSMSWTTHWADTELHILLLWMHGKTLKQFLACEQSVAMLHHQDVLWIFELIIVTSILSLRYCYDCSTPRWIFFVVRTAEERSLVFWCFILAVWHHRSQYCCPIRWLSISTRFDAAIYRVFLFCSLATAQTQKAELLNHCLYTSMPTCILRYSAIFVSKTNIFGKPCSARLSKYMSWIIGHD